MINADNQGTYENKSRENDRTTETQSYPPLRRAWRHRNPLCGRLVANRAKHQPSGRRTGRLMRVRHPAPTSDGALTMAEQIRAQFMAISAEYFGLMHQQ